MIIQPPETFVVPFTMQVVVIVAGCLIALYCLYEGIRYWKDKGSPLALLVIAGGGLAYLLEPYVDVVGLCYLGDVGQITAWSAYGRKMPLWGCALYVVFFGRLAWQFFTMVDSGTLTRKRLWQYALVIFSANLIIEIPIINSGLYLYYGDQPYKLFGFPLWWLTANGCSQFIAGSVIAKLKPLLHGPRVLIALLMPLMAWGASFTATSLPVVLALNSGVSTFVVWVAGTISLGLGGLVIYLVSLFVCIDSPLQKGKDNLEH